MPSRRSESGGRQHRLSLLAEDERVRSRITQFDATRFVIAVADDEQAALELNAQVHSRLTRAIEAGVLDGVRSLRESVYAMTDDDHEVVVRLPGATSIRGFVLDTAGDPIAGALTNFAALEIT